MFDDHDGRVVDVQEKKRQDLAAAKALVTELSELGACPELWELWDHLMDRIIVSERPQVRIHIS